MAVFDLGEEDEGFQVFKFGTVETKIDIFTALKKISDIKSRYAQFSETDSFWLEDVVSLLEQYGFQGISTATAIKFIRAISTMGEDIKKNIGLNVSSPDSTESMPSS